MDTNEILQLILKKISGIEERVTGIEERMTGIEERMSGLEGRMTTLEENQEIFREQLLETNQIVKAIRHHQEFQDAALEGLKAKTATVDSIRKIDAKINVLNDRVFEQEAEWKMAK